MPPRLLRGPTCSISAIEKILLDEDSKGVPLAHTMFNLWDLDIILHLSTVNFILQCIVKHYMQTTFDINNHWKGWFDNPIQFRRVLHESHGIVGSAAAFRFFNRGDSIGSEFQIFLEFGGLLRMGTFLEGVGFKFRPQKSDAKIFAVTALTLPMRLRLARMIKMPLPSPLSAPAVGHVIRDFVFIRICQGHEGVLKQVVRVVLLKVHPVEYILSLESSKHPIIWYITERIKI
jgi:hypothetical protein